jgi:hypothetical protein
LCIYPAHIDIPTITMPQSIVAGGSTNETFTCHGGVGHPGGALEWSFRPRGYDIFYKLPDGVVRTETVTLDNCRYVMQSSFRLRPQSSNGTTLRCKAVNNITDVGGGLETTADIMVLPGKHSLRLIYWCPPRLLLVRKTSWMGAAGWRRQRISWCCQVNTV